MNLSKLKSSALFIMLVATFMMGFAPILVRLCHLNGSSMTFWRVTLASPFLMLAWFLLPIFTRPPRSQRKPLEKPNPKAYGLLILAGITFAIDLIVWNDGVALTTIANATLFVNFAPFIVAFTNRYLLKKPLSRKFLLGMITAVIGGGVLVWPHLSLSSSLFLGDALSLLAACFYGIYLVSVHEARRFFDTCFIMLITGFISALTALSAAFILGHSLQVDTLQCWEFLIALALIVQVFGQGLIAYAMGNLSANLSAVFLLMQPLFSAIIAWWLFGEQLVVLQIVGMAIILVGIGLARLGESKAASL
jgi:drug/metabolite transporter (DMT)-like permease